MKILKLDGSVLIDLPQFETIKAAVEHCAKEKISLRWANLQGADLRWADLRWANLYGADLEGANLYGANLQGADLEGADLRWANLQGADLEGANLYGANLQGADPEGANLYGANLEGANLEGANRFGTFSKMGGRHCFFYKPIETEPTWLIIAGCFSGTLDEFEVTAKATYPNDPVQAYEAQIEYLRKILK